MTDTVTMTKYYGDGVSATANVPADAVPVWEADGWKVAEPAKGKK